MTDGTGAAGDAVGKGESASACADEVSTWAADVAVLAGEVSALTAEGADSVGGRWNFCMGRVTDCTIWGLPPTVLVRGVATMASSGAVYCLRSALKIIKPPANKPPKRMILPVLVAKKPRKLCGVMAVLSHWLRWLLSHWHLWWRATRNWCRWRRRWRQKPVHEHGELVFQGQLIASAIRRAGDSEIDNAATHGRHAAGGITDGLGINPVARPQGETIRLIKQ